MSRRLVFDDADGFEGGLTLFTGDYGRHERGARTWPPLATMPTYRGGVHASGGFEAASEPFRNFLEKRADDALARVLGPRLAPR